MRASRRPSVLLRVVAVAATLAMLPTSAALASSPDPGASGSPGGIDARVDSVIGAVDPLARSATPAPAAPRTHTLDVIWIGVDGAKKPSQAAVDSVISRMSGYWREQSDGVIRGLTRSVSVKYGRNRTDTDFCRLDTMWRDSAKAFGHTDPDWYRQGRARHLVILIPFKSGPKCQSLIGVGTEGASVHEGGLMVVPVKQNSPIDWDLSFANALADNLGLTWSHARSCTPPRVDAPFSMRTWKVQAPCNDWGQDSYSPLGGGGEDDLRRIPALNIVNRDQVGFLRAGAVQRVSVGDGEPRTYTISSLTSPSGVRGLRITDPVSRELVYVEYRSGTGRDAGSSWQRTTEETGKDYFLPGVRVLKSYVCTSSCTSRHDPFATVLERPIASQAVYQEYRSWMQAGHSLTMHTKAVRITVSSISGERARVTVSDALPDLPLWTVPAISGTARVGTPLRAVRGSWTSGTVFRYQWYAGGVAVAGATGSTFTPRASEQGKVVVVKVIGRAPGYSQKSAKSLRTAPVLPAG